MYLDDKISKDAYEEKYQEFESKIKSCKEEKMVFEKDSLSKQNISDRMKNIRTKLKNADLTDEFDRIVFESIVEKIIVGDIAADGTIDPYKLTFVLKGIEKHYVPDAKKRYKCLMKK